MMTNPLKVCKNILSQNDVEMDGQSRYNYKRLGCIRAVREEAPNEMELIK